MRKVPRFERSHIEYPRYWRVTDFNKRNSPSLTHGHTHSLIYTGHANCWETGRTFTMTPLHNSTKMPLSTFTSMLPRQTVPAFICNIHASPHGLIRLSCSRSGLGGGFVTERGSAFLIPRPISISTPARRRHSSTMVHTSRSAPPGALLFESTRAFIVFGANTEVGKTVFSALLCRNLTRQGNGREDLVAYLKPVSTGPDSESDEKCTYYLCHSLLSTSANLWCRCPFSSDLAVYCL